jgi:hypothetical protein
MKPIVTRLLGALAPNTDVGRMVGAPAMPARAAEARRRNERRVRGRYIWLMIVVVVELTLS